MKSKRGYLKGKVSNEDYDHTADLCFGEITDERVKKSATMLARFIYDVYCNQKENGIILTDKTIRTNNNGNDIVGNIGNPLDSSASLVQGFPSCIKEEK